MINVLRINLNQNKTQQNKNSKIPCSFFFIAAVPQFPWLNRTAKCQLVDTLESLKLTDAVFTYYIMNEHSIILFDIFLFAYLDAGYVMTEIYSNLLWFLLQQHICCPLCCCKPSHQPVRVTLHRTNSPLKRGRDKQTEIITNKSLSAGLPWDWRKINRCVS